MGKNKISTDTVKSDQFTGAMEHANMLMVASGEKLKDTSHEYLGSVAVHIYRNSPIEIAPAIFFKVQCLLSELVDEAIASNAWEQLKQILMVKYGRKKENTESLN